ncbi:MAG TPA: exopolysaccharide biosynthesis protein [Sphingomonadales bacterium]
MPESAITVPVPSPSGRHDGRSLSALLRQIVLDRSRDRISIADLIAISGDRAFGALLFIFATPNILPIPIPGISAMLGLPLLYLTGQLLLGYDRPWLPGIISKRSFARRDFSQIVHRILPALTRAERVLHPRLSLLTSPAMERVIGAVSFILAVLIFLPIPLGNALPGVAIGLFALGILARDGIAILLGFLTSILSVEVVSGVVYGLTVAAIFVIRQAFGI